MGLREALPRSASWSQSTPIALNLRQSEFRPGDLPGLVHSVLLETGLMPTPLGTRNHRGRAVEDSLAASLSLRRLKLNGRFASQDDFGTGIRHCRYLHPFHSTRSRSTQSSIEPEEQFQSAAIVRAVMGSHSAHLPLLAEGVEARPSSKFSLQHSRVEVQGYLLGRPRRVMEYSRLIGRTTRRQSRSAAKPSDLLSPPPCWP